MSFGLCRTSLCHSRSLLVRPVIGQGPVRMMGQSLAANATRKKLTTNYVSHDLHTGLIIGQLMPDAVGQYSSRESVNSHTNLEFNQTLRLLQADEWAYGYLQLDLKSSENIGKSRTNTNRALSTYQAADGNQFILVQILDLQTRTIVPVNTPGEMFIYRNHFTWDHWNDPMKTANATPPWIPTRELAQVDENGYVQIVGSLTETILRGEEIICPVEIEQLLETHPNISEAAVIGVPDQQLGEDLCACIRPRKGCYLTPDELRQFCLHKISYVNIPKYWVVKHEFPQTLGGYINKFEMKNIAFSCWILLFYSFEYPHRARATSVDGDGNYAQMITTGCGLNIIFRTHFYLPFLEVVIIVINC